ncbi:DNA (cytosine-5-)-methyltransferase [Streptomyces sp. NPDC002932]|uniref:DNA cytosine methyltransferase n=1 Tax=Streptomyces sp. NPDC002932 TaxID=3364672 RepID=UPI0036915AA7
MQPTPTRHPLIGSLCSGYGGLDLGVQSALGGTLAWHAEVDPNASRILARHWPGVPNLGDITTVDWSTVPRVCILTAGFPCQDVSVAGRRAGLNSQTCSGLWLHVARAVEALRPCLVVIENVRGLLTSPAGSPGDVEFCPWCLGDTSGQPPLRALGAVLGSLADLRYDARWLVLRASAVGAPHRRERTFLAAWPAGHLLKTPTSNIGHNGGSQHPAKRKSGGHGPNLSDEVEWLLPTPKTSDGIKGSPNQRHGNGDMTLPSAAASLLPTPRTSHPDTPGRRRDKEGHPPLQAVVLPLWTQSAPGARHPTNDGVPTQPPSPDGRCSPALRRHPPTRPDGSVPTSWSGCRAWSPVGSPPLRDSDARPSSPHSVTVWCLNRRAVQWSCWNPPSLLPSLHGGVGPHYRDSPAGPNRGFSGSSSSCRRTTDGARPHARYQHALPQP